jgi:tetratricopeptide (TPR) repeat protein
VRAILLVALLASTAVADPAADAQAANEEGLRLYDIHEWDAAIAKFKEAYRLRPDPLSLFNLAQASRLKGACAEALSFYRTYKRNYPDRPNIAKVEKFIAEMEACAPKPAPPKPVPVIVPVTPPPQPAPPPRPVHHTEILGLAVAGAGVLSVIGGVLFAHAASTKADEVTHLMGAWDPSLQSAGQRDAHLGIALLAIGAVAIAGGITYHFLDHTEHVVVAPQPGGVALAWSRAF